MPHGPLTPLGHRLRHVLASLRPNAAQLDNSQPALKHFQPTTRSSILRMPHSRQITSASSKLSPNAAPATVEYFPSAEGQPSERLRPISRRHENRRTKVDYLGEELRRSGKNDLAPKQTNKRGNHFNHRSSQGKRLYRENKKRHATDHIPPLEDVKTLSINRILASYLRHVQDASSALNADWMFEFKLSSVDRRYLATRGFGLPDIVAWAAIIIEPDSSEAASILLARIDRHGAQSIPLPIFSYILRRPYIAPRALRILVAHAWNLFTELECSPTSTPSPDAVFVVFVRLARHAREVWPEVLPSIAKYLVRFMPEIRSNNLGNSSKSSQAVTFMLNKAMYLISEPTAVASFKDINHQETALVHILSAMAEHDPPLQIDREGYRAVIRMQLAASKTGSEQRWAALKALSWPPWKEDKTSMDSELGPEDGISRAGQTMRRMKEAGYAPQAWENVANLYTGWDTDGTPTIQTRTVLPMRRSQSETAALWEARIRTTRTIQEAWACYLAYEDGQYPADQGVLLAILEKLHKEDLRKWAKMKATQNQPSTREDDKPLPKLYPGDTKEIAPLPPSTHLYTYTRTSPPSAHEFYVDLRHHHIELRDQCLAFLISNAFSFKAGIEYLNSAQISYPGLGHLFTPRPCLEMDRVPPALFEAYIRFLSRFSNMTMPRQWASQGHRKPSTASPSYHLKDMQYNPQHSLVQAIQLLKAHRPQSLEPWNAVLDALARSKSYETMHLTQPRDERALHSDEPPNIDSNALLAYRLTAQVLTLMNKQHTVPDRYSFVALCRSTENVGIACWKLLKSHHRTTAEMDCDLAKLLPEHDNALEAKDLLAHQRPDWRLEQYFKLLVGDESIENSNRDGSPKRKRDNPAPIDALSVPGLPRLLTTPGPAVLHAYVRALGWLGSHAKIVETLKWMAAHAPELEGMASRDRNSVNMQRRIFVAARVFLERGWLPVRDDDDGFGTRTAGEDSRDRTLWRMEAPADGALVEEARAVVEGVEDWGGWASEREVEVYCRSARFVEVV